MNSSDGENQDRIHGVCGNLNCDQSDDWTFKDGTPCTDTSDNGGAYDRSQCEFDAANSFICNPEEAIIGELNPPDDLPECTADITARCDNLFNDAAFASCLNVVTEEDGTNKDRVCSQTMTYSLCVINYESLFMNHYLYLIANPK